MSRLLYCILFIFSFWIQNHDCTSPPQIKVLRTEEKWFNPKYIKAIDYTIVKHNDTYNNLKVHRLEVIEDLPEDIALHSKVYVTDKSGGNEQLLLENEILICKENKYRELLPKVAVVDKSLLGGKCYKKGIYELEDKGQLRFDILIPNLEQKGKYYKAYYEIISSTEKIAIDIYYSVWGYLEE